MRPESTILAYADQPGVRVERLLWSLATRRPSDAFRMVLADLTPYGDEELARQLVLYKSAFPSKLVRPHGGVGLGTLTSGAVLVLPASAVPVADAVERMFRLGTCAGVCLAPGPLCALGMDDLGSNLTTDVVTDCPPAPDVGSNYAWAMCERDWRRPDQDHCWSLCEAKFILYPPPLTLYRAHPDSLVMARNCS